MSFIPACLGETRPRFISALLFVLMLCVINGFAPVAAAQQSSQQQFLVSFEAPGQVVELRISPNKSMTIRTNVTFDNIVVGNPEIADIKPLTTMSLYILGKSAGRTNLAFYNKQKELIGVIDLAVGVDLDELRAAIRDAAPRANVRASVANGRVRLSGTVQDSVTLQTVLEVAQDFDPNPINTIRVLDSQQVLLEVRIIEASRSAGRDLGISWAARDKSNPNLGAVVGIDTTTPTLVGDNSVAKKGVTDISTQPFSALVGNILSAGINIDVVIRALEAKNLARRLAEPNLTTRSGSTASFLAGGQVPYQVVDKNGNPSTAFKDYGVQLKFTPTVLDDGLISLNLNPEISDIDPALSVGGQFAFITRSANTTVELHDGQSFAIAGLLRTSNIKQQDQVPWLGQVPVLGSLFKSSSFQKQQTDLVVMVTPHIVRPARPGEPLKTPLDNTRPSNDPEFFLLGLLEVTPDLINGFANGKGIVGPYGHIIDLPGDTSYVATKP